MNILEALEQDLEVSVLEDAKDNKQVVLETAEMALETVKRYITGTDEWTGEFTKKLRIEKVTDYQYIIYSDVIHAHLVEFGHDKEKFWPFSMQGGEMTRLGLWAIEKLGYSFNGEINDMGFLILRDTKDRPRTGLKFTMAGKKPFRKTEAQLKDKVNGVEVRFEFKGVN